MKEEEEKRGVMWRDVKWGEGPRGKGIGEYLR